MRQKWSGLPARALASVLEPNLWRRVLETVEPTRLDVFVQESYLNFFLAEGDLPDKLQTRCLVGLWIAFICLFQDRLILSATAVIRDSSKRFHLFARVYLVLFRFCLANGLSSTLGGRLFGTVDDEWLRKA